MDEIKILMNYFSCVSYLKTTISDALTIANNPPTPFLRFVFSKTAIYNGNFLSVNKKI